MRGAQAPGSGLDSGGMYCEWSEQGTDGIAQRIGHATPACGQMPPMTALRQESSPPVGPSQRAHQGLSLGPELGWLVVSVPALSSPVVPLLRL